MILPEIMFLTPLALERVNRAVASSPAPSDFVDVPQKVRGILEDAIGTGPLQLFQAVATAQKPDTE